VCKSSWTFNTGSIRPVLLNLTKSPPVTKGTRSAQYDYEQGEGIIAPERKDSKIRTVTNSRLWGRAVTVWARGQSTWGRGNPGQAYKKRRDNLGGGDRAVGDGLGVHRNRTSSRGKNCLGAKKKIREDHLNAEW